MFDYGLGWRRKEDGTGRYLPSQIGDHLQLISGADVDVEVLPAQCRWSNNWLCAVKKRLDCRRHSRSRLRCPRAGKVPMPES